MTDSFAPSTETAGEPTLAPEAAPVIAAAGAQAITTLLTNRRTIGVLLVGVLTLALVAGARKWVSASGEN